MPVITVSRMFGAGGAELASRVAGELGWTLVDNAFVDGVAGRLGVTPASVQAIEERLPTLAERIADAFAFGATEVVSASLGGAMPPTEKRVVEVTTRIIDEALAHGPAVVVGRGAQSYLRARADALHVLCCAPTEPLIARVMEREGLDRTTAEALVQEKNRQRAEWVRRHWNREWLEPANYHLCLNTAWLSLDRAAVLVLRVARERFGLVTRDA